MHDRTSVLNLLDSKKFKSVVDVGSSVNPWAGSHITHTIDIIPMHNNYHAFIGNICEQEVWEEVKVYLKGNKFDFAICTHTLEDILNPLFVIKQLSQIATAGYIAMPSKWVELTRHNLPWKGWQHHRWVFDVIDNKLVCLPKLPYLEYMDTENFRGRPEEIALFWDSELPSEILNADYMGPDDETFRDMVRKFLNYTP